MNGEGAMRILLAGLSWPLLMAGRLALFGLVLACMLAAVGFWSTDGLSWRPLAMLAAVGVCVQLRRVLD